MPSFSHLTSCTATKPNLNLANSLAAVVREPDLYRLLTFQVPSFVSFSHPLDHTNGQSRSKAPVYVL